MCTQVRAREKTGGFLNQVPIDREFPSLNLDYFYGNLKISGSHKVPINFEDPRTKPIYDGNLIFVRFPRIRF